MPNPDSEQLARACGVAWLCGEWAGLDHNIPEGDNFYFPDLFTDSLPAREFALTVAWPRLAEREPESLGGVLSGRRVTTLDIGERIYGPFDSLAEAINRALAEVVLSEKEMDYGQA